MTSYCTCKRWVVRFWYCSLRCRSRFLRFPPQGSDGEKLIPARHAAQRGKPKQAADCRGQTGNVFRRNALQFQVSADGAVRVDYFPQRYAPRPKPRFAGFTAPRQHADETEKVISRRPATGTPEIRTATCRANSRGRVNLRTPETNRSGTYLGKSRPWRGTIQ